MKPSHGWNWKGLAAAGKLACPESGKTLSATEARALETADGSSSYKVLPDGVPLLLRDPAMIEGYLAASAMPAEYNAMGEPENRPVAGAVGKLKAFLHRDYRSAQSEAAFARLFADARPGELRVSVGGGPHRDHPSLVNLNIGPFANVDLVADAHALPFSDGAVDAGYSSAVLEHLYDPSRAVRELFRVIKPGGLVYARTPFLQQYHGYPHHYQNFTLTGHRRLFESAGFAVLEAGVDVGPTFAFVHLANYYLQDFAPFPFRSRAFRSVWNLFANAVLKPRDRFLNAREDAHTLASTTYLLARKP
jgi:SAM-dependent methyltransferase